MEWLKVLVQRRLLASALGIVAGWVGLEHATSQLADVGVALLTFVPAALNLLSYFSKVSIAGLEPAMLAGIIPILASFAAQAGVPIPTEVQESVTSNAQVLIAAVMSLLSAVTTNDVQPVGKLATPNP